MKSVTIPKANGAPNNRGRAITETNRLLGGIPAKVSAAEFDLAGLALWPIPVPNAERPAPSGDLAIRRYRISQHSFFGSKGRGIFDPFPSVASRSERLEAAPNASLPLFGPAPLPFQLELALEFNRDSELGVVTAYRGSQPRYLRQIALESQSSTCRIYASSHPEIRQAAANVHIAILTQLVDSAGVNGPEWIYNSHRDSR